MFVDTPGIGESDNMEQLLLDYIRQNDVFGFIFTIKCDDAGGVLLRVSNYSLNSL